MTFRSLGLAAATLLLAAGTANAASLAPAPLALAPLATMSDAPIVLVREGCGFGEHRGPYGGCRLNNGPRGALRARLTGLPRGCPPGRTRGYYGRCNYTGF